MELVKISDLTLDTQYYPRLKTDWFTAYKYAKAMKTGSKFPPITITKLENQLIVLDGWHRISAVKQNKEEYIQVNRIQVKDQKEAYFKAVELNAFHGRQFTTQERVAICGRLEEFKIPKFEISQLIGVLPEDFKKFTYNKITHAISGKEVILKAPLKHLAGVQVSEDFEAFQSGVFGMSAVKILDLVISMLENGVFNLSDVSVVGRLNRIKQLVDGGIKAI